MWLSRRQCQRSNWSPGSDPSLAVLGRGMCHKRRNMGTPADHSGNCTADIPSSMRRAPRSLCGMVARCMPVSSMDLAFHGENIEPGISASHPFRMRARNVPDRCQRRVGSARRLLSSARAAGGWRQGRPLKEQQARADRSPVPIVQLQVGPPTQMRILEHRCRSSSRRQACYEKCNKSNTRRTDNADADPGCQPFEKNLHVK